MREPLIREVTRALEANGVAFALIGAVAVAARGASRETADIDLLTTDSRVLRFDWSSILTGGAAADARRGEHDDPLAGVITFSSDTDDPVDLVIGRWKWQTEAIARAEPMDLGFAVVPVLTAEDLVIAKLDAGGPGDLHDVDRLVEARGESLIHAVEQRLPDVAEIRDQWRAFRQTWRR
jgi:predicted nucleotidyltransferase